MGKTELASAIADARASLATTLASLRPEQWEDPSLCEEWLVRDVVGHLLHQYNLYRAPYPRLAFVLSGFRVNRYLATEARRVAQGRSPSELTSALSAARFETTIGWKLSPRRVFVLTEFVVHTQDIRRALHLDGAIASAHLSTAANVLTRSIRFNPFQPKLPPTQFEATDIDWSTGEGPTARGPLESLVMVIAGRVDALNDLSGEGVEPLRAALS